MTSERIKTIYREELRIMKERIKHQKELNARTIYREGM